MKALSGRAILKITEKEQATKSGIILAKVEGQSALVREIFSNEGVIESISSLDQNRYGISEGETVIFSRWGSQELPEGRVSINCQDIVAKLEDISS